MNRIAQEVSGREKDLLPFPLQSRIMGSLRQAAIAREKMELLSLWAGQIAPVLRYTRAADLMTALIADSSAYFDKTK
jgi:nitronate monooxygenase